LKETLQRNERKKEIEERDADHSEKRLQTHDSSALHSCHVNSNREKGAQEQEKRKKSVAKNRAKFFNFLTKFHAFPARPCMRTDGNDTTN